jgi:hypothetical protein
MYFCEGFLPYLTSLHFKASGTRSLSLHDLAVYRLPRDHGVDTHALHLVGIHGISCVLLVRVCQLDADPQDHILTFGLTPNTSFLIILQLDAIYDVTY